MDDLRLALYFGYRSGGGHYLQDHSVSDSIWITPEEYSIPWSEGQMDATLLKNGKHIDEYDGKVFWTCGGKIDLWHAFFWWDRSGDKRPNSNSGFYVRGYDIYSKKYAFEYACKCYSDVVDRQHHPLILQN